MPQGVVCVLDPAPYLEVTVEQGSSEDPEIHVHPAGQGFWVARMAARLGADVTLVAPFGGEVGTVLPHLIEQHGVGTAPVSCHSSSGAVVTDRRSPSSAPASARSAELSRHERDDLHGTAFSSAIRADVFVLVGSRTPLSTDEMYRRLAADVRANGVPVLADMSGTSLSAVLAGGVDLLKVSDEQLRHDGYLSGDGADEVVSAMGELKRRGAAQVVVSRGAEPCLADLDGEVIEVRAPQVDPVDPSGGGDSMTGALAAAIAREEPSEVALRLAMAAATAGVLRHGLASAQRSDVERLADQMTIAPHRSRT